MTPGGAAGRSHADCVNDRSDRRNVGRLDVLIRNNPRIANRTSLVETSEASFDMVSAVNLKSAFFGGQIRDSVRSATQRRADLDAALCVHAGHCMRR
jgi:NAD(P)-dependent dehydrogenase (short-subunit alcohol dehydrogenase family)